MQKAHRPTLKIVCYAIVDVVGMVLLATGAVWLAQGKLLFFPGFPTSTPEALAATAGGLLLMFWAATRILRELAQRPASHAREDG
jgi:hypothetical protein